MKTLRLAGLLLLPSWSLLAQTPEQTPAPAPADAAVMAPTRLNAEQLEQLLGPIALYPDALIALILPASTQPADIVLAARYLRDNAGNLSQVESRAWDESVKSLTHYPEVLKWLDENLNWTKQLGEAFAEQPAEVMKAVQRLRAKAQANGALADTPQQQVLVEPATSVIRIVPAQPDVIYVPYYDPTVVYVPTPIYVPRHPLVTFGIGCRVGSWLCADFNWVHCTLWVGDRHRHWEPRHDWRRPVVPVATVTVISTGSTRSYADARPPRQWQPSPRSPRPAITQGTPRPATFATAATIPNVPRPTYRTSPTMEIARPPTTIGRQPMFNNVANENLTPSPATPAPQIATAPGGRVRPADASRPADRPRIHNNPPTIVTAPAISPVPAPAVTAPANALPAVTPLHIAGGTRAQYPTVAPAPSAHAHTPTATYVPPPQAAPAPAITPAPAPSAPASTPAPANPAPQDPGDRRHRDRRNID